MNTQANKQQPLRLFYIGTEYATRSKLMMGELYEEGDREHRLAWDILADYVARGQNITIRPATPTELAWAEARTVDYERFWQHMHERSDNLLSEYDTLLKER